MTETAKDAARRIAAPMLAKGFKPEALHHYRDMGGNILYSRIRMKHPDTGEKWIRPMHLNGGGYVMGEPKANGPKPLYNLHRLSLYPGAPVLIVEGEKAADALTRAGIVATTSGGAESAERADWTPLKGRDCIIWRDRDEAGQKYADQVREILAPLGCSLFAVNVDSLGLPDKGDAADWMAANSKANAGDVLALANVEALQPTPKRDGPEAQPSAPNATAARVDGGKWPELCALRVDVRAEPYPLDALPGRIGAAVREVVGFVQCPDALAACSALSAVSVAAQGLVDVQRDEKLSGPPSLFLLAVAESGERKTTCDGYFSSALREWEAAEQERMKPEIAKHSAAVKAWEARREGLLAKIKNLSREDKPSDREAGELAELEADKPQPPRVPRVLYGDTTPEALAFNLTRWPSAAVQSSEAGIVFGGHGMKGDAIMRNLALLNVLWEGGALAVDRRQSESFTIRGARLTMGLAVQPETVRAFLESTKGLARGTGFAARFLIAWPESTQGTRRFRAAPASWPNLSTFHRRVSELLRMPLTFNEAGELRPAALPLTPEAKAAWIAFHDEVEAELRPGGEMIEARDVASKAADNAARLAALFHVFENGPTGAIAEDHLRAGATIAAWHLYESRRFLGMLGQPRSTANAGKLEAWAIRYCREHGTNAAPRREAQQYAVRDGDALSEAIAELAKAGRARLIEDGAKRLIELHPELLEEARHAA